MGGRASSRRWSACVGGRARLIAPVGAASTSPASRSPRSPPPAPAPCSRPRAATRSSTATSSATTTTASTDRGRAPTSTSRSATRYPRDAAIDYIEDHLSRRVPLVVARTRRTRAGACSSPARPRSSTGRSRGAGARRRGSRSSPCTCSLFVGDRWPRGVGEAAGPDPAAARVAASSSRSRPPPRSASRATARRRRSRSWWPPRWASPRCSTAGAATPAVATATSRCREPRTARARRYARRTMTAADLDDHERNTGLLAAELPDRRYVDERVPAVALRREPRTGPRSSRQRRRRTACRVAHYAHDPAALPRRRRARSLPRSRCTRSCAPAPSARAVPAARRRRSIDAASAAGLEVRHRRVQRQVDRRRREVPRLEDARAAAGAGRACRSHRGRGVESHAVDADFLTRDRPPSSRHDLDDVPVRTWTNSRTPRLPRGGGCACPTRLVHGARQRRPGRGQHHRHRLRRPRRGDPEAPAPRRPRRTARRPMR